MFSWYGYENYFLSAQSGGGFVRGGLIKGVETGFAPRDAEGLQHAAREDRAGIEAGPYGFGIHFPGWDVGLYDSASLEGVLGSAIWTSTRLDGAGGLAVVQAGLEANTIRFPWPKEGLLF